MNLNNLNALRMVAAGLVLYGHSFVFLGLREPLFLSWIPLGSLGLNIFFIISGYLVSESWDRDPQLVRFFIKRGLRIFPGLIVCTTLSILVLGPLLTTRPLQEYFSNPGTLAYFQNIALHIVYYLPGVFENNRLANAVNGSIWSLPVEFTLYIAVAAIGFLQGNRWVFVAMAAISAFLTIKWAWATDQMLVIYNYDLRQLVLCGTYFWIGSAFQKFNLKRFFSLSSTLMASMAMLCLEPWPSQLSMASWILLPIIVLSFGLAHSPLLERLTRSGDYSYGIYIYAFPIQQAIVSLRPQIGILEYLITSSAIILVLSMASWHWVERPALSLKSRLKERILPSKPAIPANIH